MFNSLWTTVCPFDHLYYVISLLVLNSLFLDVREMDVV